MTARILLSVATEELRSQAVAALTELGTEVELVGVATTTGDTLLGVDTATDLDVVIVDDTIGPLPYQTLVRDLLIREPELAVLVISDDHSASMFATVMDTGARGLLASPPSPSELTDRLAGVLDWQRRLRARQAAAGLGLGAGLQPGRLIAFTGAKGGVGTSTLALHTALLAVASNPGRTICLIDLDLQHRGLRHLLDATPRRSIADLVLVSDALTGRNLDEAGIVHRSGLRALFAPANGEQAEEVSGEVARQILGVAKSHYDLIVVDAGSVVTEASAVAMEFADSLVLVATPDVPSIRAAQDKVDLLDRLQVAKSGDIRTLLAQVHSRSEIQPEFAHRMLTAEPLRTTIPLDAKRLESAANAMAPTDLEDGPFRRGVVALGRELGLALRQPNPRLRVTTPR